MLVVEDNALVTDALTILLESAGHAVAVAPTVADAVTRATEVRPDVMLLDLTLPDGDGLEALAHLDAAGARPPVTAALTGHDDPRVRARCLAAGCREVLVKPVPARELLARVGAWVDEVELERDGRRAD